jgi:ribosomal protein S18 acetylase RimI-like enzyme
VDSDALASLLETDRVWTAYALADLDPPWAADAEWRTREGSVVLCYRGFTPPVLFAHGDPQAVGRLLEEIAPGSYQYALLGIHRALVRERLRPTREAAMWRMWLPPNGFNEPSNGSVERLSASDLPAMLELFSADPTPPDAFDPSQLEGGCFYGVWEGRALVAVAGTHVVSEPRGVAAIGNVLTRKDRRGSGLAQRTTGAVSAELIRRGLRTIVLNVAMDNAAAIGAYRALGFMPFCGYYEGIGQILPRPTSGEERQDV